MGSCPNGLSTGAKLTKTGKSPSCPPGALMVSVEPRVDDPMIRRAVRRVTVHGAGRSHRYVASIHGALYRSGRACTSRVSRCQRQAGVYYPERQAASEHSGADDGSNPADLHLSSLPIPRGYVRPPSALQPWNQWVIYPNCDTCWGRGAEAEVAIWGLRSSWLTQSRDKSRHFPSDRLFGGRALPLDGGRGCNHMSRARRPVGPLAHDRTRHCRRTGRQPSDDPARSPGSRPGRGGAGAGRAGR